VNVKIGIEFKVLSADGDEIDEETAKAAASLAAYHYLSFCKVSGVHTDTPEVEVHVDGFGECRVALGGDHD
jgi:hypothetical protein